MQAGNCQPPVLFSSQLHHAQQRLVRVCKNINADNLKNELSLKQN